MAKSSKKRVDGSGCPHRDGSPCPECVRHQALIDAYERRHRQLLDLPTSRFTKARDLRTVLSFNLYAYGPELLAAGSPIRADFDAVYVAMIERSQHIPVPE